MSPVIRRISDPSRVFLTSTRGDGGGAQWHGRFSAMAFADRHNIKYVPSRFNALKPDSSQEIMDLWSDLFVGSFSVPKNIPEPRKADSIIAILWCLIGSFVRQRPILIDSGHCHFYTDFHPSAIRHSLELHGVRYANPANLKIRRTKGPRIAMHVRRGLSWEPNFTSNRLTGDEEVLQILEWVGRHERIRRGTVFSAVQNPFIEDRLPNGFDYNSSANEFELIHNIINADVAIIAKSCLSYVAAAFATGTVYYEPFFHPPMPGWHRLEAPSVTQE